MTPSPYTRAQFLVRQRAGQLSIEAAAQIERALRQYADRLGRMVRALPSDPASAAAVSRRAVLAMADDLHRQMQRAVLNGRDLSYAEVQSLWADAGTRVAKAMGTVPLAAVGGVAAPTLTLAGAYEMLGGAAQTWKTRLAGYARASAADADAIIRDALLTGVPQDKLATALRPYVTGAKEFHEAFGDKVFDQLKDLRASNVPADLRDAARKVKYQAERIAYSEIWNARAEASLAAFAADPMIEAVRWVLSPNRGALSGADECVPAGTMIATDSVPRPIEEVRIGDLVLTHRGRLRLVTRLYRRTIQAGQLVRIRCRAASNRTPDLRLTPNHPVLTGRGWVEAGALRADSDLVTWHEPPGVPPCRPSCDTLRTPRRGSDGSAPSAALGIAASVRCGAGATRARRTPHSAGRGGSQPTPTQTSASGTVRCRTTRPSNGDSSGQAVLPRTGDASRVASASAQSSDSRNWGSLRLARSGDIQRSNSAYHCARALAGMSSRILGTRGAEPDGPHSHTDESNIAGASRGSVSPRTGLRRSGSPSLPESPVTHPCKSASRNAASSHACSEGQGPCRSVHNSSSYVHHSQFAAARQEKLTSQVWEDVTDMPVFNLGVEEDHSYVANGVVVHNCDALADSDFYGLGPGVYPIAQVPYPPHPWCRCEREPVIRPPEQAGEPKPNPSLRLDPSKAKVAPEGVMVTAAQRDRVRERVGALLNASRAPAAQAATVAIMDQAAQSVVAQQIAAMAGRT